MKNKYFEELLTYQYGLDLTNEIIKNCKKKFTTLRINTLKSDNEEIENILKENKISFIKPDFSNEALILTNTDEVFIKDLDIYKDGKIYLQSLSSQLPPLFLNVKEGETVLDMAAAPGSKTTQIAALTNNKAMITAVEKNKKRYMRLIYNLEKQGAKKVTVLNKDVTKLDNYFIFDKILLDAPCSGSGTLTNPNNFFLKDIELNNIVNLQKTLLNKAYKHLKIGGELIYSTCSILKNENEEIIKDFLEKEEGLEIIPINLKDFKDIPLLPVTLDGTICIKPSNIYEGFYIAKLRKNS